jgi:hypothetical protein
MENETSDKKKSLFDEWKEAEIKARMEFEKLTPDEQKKYLLGSIRLQHRIDVENACMCGLPIPPMLTDEEIEKKANKILKKMYPHRQ